MKELNNFILEKLKLNKNTEPIDDSCLFKSLNLLISCNEDSVIFDNEEIREKYHIHQMTISYNYNTKWVTIDHIVINGHNQGYGTRFMQEICDWADLNDINLCLTPSNSFGSHLGRLKKFYKRFGFIENKGKYADFTTKESMIRKIKK